MGKSTVLTRLAEIIRDNEPSLLVIKINLTDHTKVFASEPKNRTFNSDGAVDFLVDELIPNLEPEAVLVFKTMIKVQRAALLFDGFDEISPHYKEIVVDLIHAFSKLGVKKLFVTTRPHTSRALEEKLGVFSHSLQPFSRVTQVEFFTKFWKSGISSSHDEAGMERHANRLITLLTKTIDRSMQKFTGVPLQTRMVAEVFPYAEGSELAEKLPESITIIELYRRFVDTKYEIYKQVKSNCDFTNPANKDNDKEYRQSFSKKHQKFSLDALFDDETVKLLTGNPIVIESCESSSDGTEDEAAVRQGMILRFIEGKPQFIHRTFAEYFAATFLFEIMIDDSRNQSVREFFVARLFVRSEYQVIRAFLNCLLTDKGHVGQKNSWPFILKQHCDSSGRTAYHVAARERHDGIVKFLLDRLTEDHRLEFSNINYYSGFRYGTPLTTAIETPDNFKVVKCFVDAGANIDRGRSGCYETPLRAAIEGNLNFDAIEYILKERHDIESGIIDDAVICAAERGELDVLKLFEMNGVHLHCNNFEPLAAAAESGHLEVVEYLVQKGGKIDSHTGVLRATPLYLAARSGEFEVVEYLMENGANINATSGSGETPLHGATASGHLDVVEHLIERGANIHSRTHATKTSLHLAVRSREFKTVEYLVENGADIHCRDLYGATPLHYAAEIKKKEEEEEEVDEANIVELLIERGANIHASDNFSRTVMYYAARSGIVETVELLTEEGASIHFPDCFGETPMHRAALSGNLDLVQYLRKKGANIHSKTIRGETPVYFAVRSGKIDVVQYLVEQGAGIHVETEDRETLLHQAVKSGFFDIVEYLIEKGVKDIQARTKDGKTPLHYAVFHRNLDLVKFFVEKGVDINSKTEEGETPLHRAARRGILDVVEYLTENGATIDSPTNDGQTPLHYAARSGKLDVVKFFVEKGVDINSKTEEGETPLHQAARRGILDVVEYLTEHGATIDSPIDDGQTPLHYAARFGHLDVVEYLVKRSADIHSQTKDGMTPLHLAVTFRRTDIVKHLAANGADVRSPDRYGQTPLHSAALCDALEVVKFLTDAGADVHCRNKNGRTSLQVAVKHRAITVRNYLTGKVAENPPRTPKHRDIMEY